MPHALENVSISRIRGQDMSFPRNGNINHRETGHVCVLATHVTAHSRVPRREIETSKASEKWGKTYFTGI